MRHVARDPHPGPLPGRERGKAGDAIPFSEGQGKGLCPEGSGL